MLRLAFTITSALSLLLLIAAAVLWVRSHTAPSVGDIGESYAYANRDGQITFMDQWLIYYSPRAPVLNPQGRPVPGSLPVAWTFLLPWWMVVVACALTPAAWLATWPAHRRRVRRRRGLCERCGYDLRGSKGARACPECGANKPVA